MKRSTTALIVALLAFAVATTVGVFMILLAKSDSVRDWYGLPASA